MFHPFHLHSEANLNVSSASEPEATSKEPEAPVQGASVASEKEVGVKEDDSLIYNIHLSLPGVSVPVEVVVSREVVYCHARRVSWSWGAFLQR